MTLAIERLPNTLVNAHHARWLYASAWLTSPERSLEYRECNFVEAPPLLYEGKPIPVRIDKASATYTRSRLMTYDWEPYVHEDTHAVRLRITAILVRRNEPPRTNEPLVELPLSIFLERYLVPYDTTVIIDEDSDDDVETRVKRR